MKTIVSGIQPTAGGSPHIGNYIGAMLAYKKLQNDNTAYFMVADQHATTVAYDPKALKAASMLTAASLFAIGIDPDQATVFVQSSVREHSLLAQVFSLSVASMGPLERMTQFKDKSGASKEIGLGLFTYPVLMAADILLYKADLVPVGNDQHQHLQFACEIAKRFNHRFKADFFPEPKPYFQPNKRIMSLSDPLKKMSKSAVNQSGTVYLTDNLSVAAKKYKQAVSDPDYLPGEPAGLIGRAAASNLIAIFCELSGCTPEQACSKFANQPFSALKTALTQAHEQTIIPVQRKIDELLSVPDVLTGYLSVGKYRAKTRAAECINSVYELVGFES